MTPTPDAPRRPIRPAFLFALLAISPSLRAQGIDLVPIASALEAPVALTHAGDGSGRIFITEQPGRIRIWRDGALVSDPFLDLRPLVSFGGEQGLFSVAFHPRYSENGLFFVNYTDRSGDTIVARYRVSPDDPDRADPASATTILTVDQPFANHNGGQLQFGPDGYLFIGMGDGGSGGDPQNNAQNLGTLLGKLLRIDVDAAPAYAIPPDNPFAAVPGARGEIWSYGLRNPWRFSFDRLTGDLFIGDVGQNALEEIDFAPASSRGGENWGWRRMEGTRCFEPPANCNDGSLALPILEYGRSEGCSVTGGYVVRRSGALFGTYLYGDFCSGRIWGARAGRDGRWASSLVLDTSLRISSFGEDEAGRIYVIDHRGSVYRIETAARRRPARRPQP